MCREKCGGPFDVSQRSYKSGLSRRAWVWVRLSPSLEDEAPSSPPPRVPLSSAWESVHRPEPRPPLRARSRKQNRTTSIHTSTFVYKNDSRTKKKNLGKGAKPLLPSSFLLPPSSFLLLPAKAPKPTHSRTYLLLRRDDVSTHSRTSHFYDAMMFRRTHVRLTFTTR